jgi:hypothetical protein
MMTYETTPAGDHRQGISKTFFQGKGFGDARFVVGIE